jgi:hypothetical protein
VTGLFNGIYRGAFLRAFEQTPVDLPLGAIEAELSRHHPAWHTAEWPRLPNLLATALRQHGLELRHARPAGTASSAAGGTDAYLLLVSAGGTDALVVCRHEAPSGAARLTRCHALVGLEVDWRAGDSRLVLRSNAADVAALRPPLASDADYRLTLAAASELLTRLNGYDAGLPPLDRLDEAVRAEIIRTNAQALG